MWKHGGVLLHHRGLLGGHIDHFLEAFFGIVIGRQLYRSLEGSRIESHWGLWSSGWLRSNLEIVMRLAHPTADLLLIDREATDGILLFILKLSYLGLRCKTVALITKDIVAFPAQTSCVPGVQALQIDVDVSISQNRGCFAGLEISWIQFGIWSIDVLTIKSVARLRNLILLVVLLLWKLLVRVQSIVRSLPNVMYRLQDPIPIG